MALGPHSLAARDIAHLLHPVTNLAQHQEKGPLVLTHGKGVMVYDAAGHPYIDAMAGLWCTALGYGVEELVHAASEQMRKLAYSPLFASKSHEPAIALAEKLCEIAPFKASKVFFGNSGSDANDTQVKLAWYYNNARGQTSKKKIIARQRGYHGVTVASASLTGLPLMHRDFDLPIAGILHTDCPHHYRHAEAGESEEDFSARLAGNLRALIEREGPETVAAFIAEPVMGAGGVILPPAGYFAEIRKVLDEHDILLIDDEVICAFHRTGAPFGCESFAFTPDTMSVAKALSSAYLPISAALIPETMYAAFVHESRKIGSFGHGFTYTGHPVCAAVALKALELMESWKLAERVRKLAPLFQTRLHALADHELVGEARGLGLIGGIELVADKKTKRSFAPSAGLGAYLVARAQDDGVILRAIGDTVAFCPPLVVNEAEIEQIFDSTLKALDETAAHVRKEGLRTA
jgi:4-aminobutyrate--pyruvate transaminase